MTTDRADRPAFGAEDAAAELRRLVSLGRAGAARERTPFSRPPATANRRRPRRAGPQNPGGCLVERSTCCDLAARGLTTREIADRLFISPKTADHHIQHIYTKIGVSTRAAAALWAMQNAVVS